MDPAAREPAEAALAAGTLLAGRYRILRLLGRGGMGEVYEAADEALGEAVALKTIRAGQAGAPDAVDRFKREVQLARRVTHPHVCRLFELGLHRKEDGSEVVFLTMELLAGETLADRLQRAGPLSAEEALPIALQVGSALQAAHEAGVLHLDLKCANIILAPAAEGVRAVVTDFGTAHAPGAVRQLQGNAERVVGTPAYMAPEQVAGQPLGVAADVYAFGVVLFEMRTGGLPFQGADSTEVAVQRLEVDAPRARRRRPEVEAAWDAAIARCLERDPARRFTQVRQVVQALDAPRARPWILAAAAAGIALLAGVVLWTAGPRVPPPRAVAVLGVRPARLGTPSWRGQALSEALTAALRADGFLRVSSAEEVERLRQDLSLGDSAGYAQATLERVARNLGVEVAISGLVEEGAAGALELELTALDVRDGRERARVRARGEASALPALAVSAARGLLQALRLPPPGPGAEAAVEGAIPGGAAAAPYFEGLARLRASDVARARTLLEEAARLEPGRAATQRALSDVRALQQDPGAAEAAGRAAALLPASARYERMLDQAAFAQRRADWPEAARLLRQAFEERGELEVGLRLAEAENASGNALEARRVLDTLRQKAPPLGDDPRIDLREADLLWNEDAGRARAAIDRAVATAEGRGARTFLADALATRAQIAWVQGDLDRAAEAAERARTVHALIGARWRMVVDLNVLTAVRWQQGRLGEAAAFAAEGAALQREIGNRWQLAEDVSNLGMIELKRGRRAEARARFEEALALRAADDPVRGVPLFGLGWLAAVEGDRERAARLYAQAEPLVEVANQPYVLGFLWIRQGELLAAQGDAAGARQRWEKTRALAARTGLRVLGAEARLAEAELLLGQGRAAEAEALARGLQDELLALQATDLRAHALSLEARGALLRHDEDAARRAAEAAVALQHDNALVAALAYRVREDVRRGSSPKR